MTLTRLLLMIARSTRAATGFGRGSPRPGRGDARDWIEVEALALRQKSAEPLAVVDVRGPDEFVGPPGHIPGSLNIPIGELERRLDELSSLRAATVVLVCRTDKRSAKSLEIMRAQGFANPVVLRGGMERWNALGLETVRDASDSRPATT